MKKSSTRGSSTPQRARRTGDPPRAGGPERLALRDRSPTMHSRAAHALQTRADRPLSDRGLSAAHRVDGATVQAETRSGAGDVEEAIRPCFDAARRRPRPHTSLNDPARDGSGDSPQRLRQGGPWVWRAHRATHGRGHGALPESLLGLISRSGPDPGTGATGSGKSTLGALTTTATSTRGDIHHRGPIEYVHPSGGRDQARGVALRRSPPPQERAAPSADVIFGESAT